MNLAADKRQFGALLMLLGFCAIIQPLANIANGIGPDGVEYGAGKISFWRTVGAFCIFINGVVSVMVGYLAAVHDFSHRYLTGFLIVIIQSAFIPYISDMTMVGKAARAPAAENVIIPQAYAPTDPEVHFIGTLGVLAILFYGFAFVGSISFMAFCLHAYNTGEMRERSGIYFEGRLSFYAGVLALAGLVQLTLGAFCRVKVGSTILEEGPVRAAMLTVTYPAISIFIGFLQCLTGCWGVARSVGCHCGANDFSYQLFLAFQWILVLCLQCITQIAYLPGGEMAAAAPTFAAVSLGVNLMPAFLDHKMRTLPRFFSPDDYGLSDGSDNQDSMSKNSETMEGLTFNDEDVTDRVEV